MQNIPGVLIGRGQFDWQAGANSPIVHVALQEDGDWTKIKIPNEIQFNSNGKPSPYDTSMCVSYNGNTDPIEYILTRQIELGLVPQSKVQWLKDNGYFKDGVLNFNERFIGSLGETNESGAYQYKVANAVKNYGMIPNDMFKLADTFKDNIDKKFITQEMYDLGKEFTKRFKINYEWVEEKDVDEYLTYSPLACYGYFANGDGILNPQSGSLHCMLAINKTPEYIMIDDSYWQNFKKYNHNALHGFMAFYVDASTNSMFNRDEFIQMHDTSIIRNTNTGAYGVIYQKTPMLITSERAGLFMIDRESRKLIGKTSVISLNNDEWNALGVNKNF